VNRYNPFGKDIREIQAADLQMLGSVSEGWYVEYKRQVPCSKSIAKSISSFANQYGGWLFYGIVADTNGNNMPTSYPGIDINEWSREQGRISSAVAEHVFPAPFFECRFIRGPADDVELEDGRGIVVVYVPRGTDAPFVHSSGWIYRRIADQSTPVPEKDRAALDQLWRRRDEARRELREFLLRGPELSDTETELPHLSIYFLCDPLGDRGFRTTLDIEGFRDIAQSVDSRYLDFPLDSVFSGTDSYFGRQCADNNSAGFCPILRHYFDGTTVVSLPIRTYPLDSSQGRRELLRYENGQRFLDILSEHGMGTAHWIDLNILLALYIGAYIKHRKFCERGGIAAQTFTKSRFSSLWRKIPYIDAVSYLSVLETHGIPVIQEDEIWSPPTLELDSFHSIEFHDLAESDSGAVNAAAAWGRSLGALGLRSLVSQEEIIVELLEALTRGIETHRGGTEGP
jgi:hypothetical protein